MVFWYLIIPALACLIVAVGYPNVRVKDEGSKRINWKIMGVLQFCLFALLGIALVSLSLLSFAFLLGLVVAVPVAAGVRCPAVVFVPFMLFCTLLVYAGPYQEATVFKEKVTAYQNQFPFESIEDRLAYETPEAIEGWQYLSTEEFSVESPFAQKNKSESEYGELPVLADITEPLVAPPAQNNLVVLKVSYGDSFDQMRYGAYQDRREALAIVHGGWERRFAVLMGQGVFRMRWMHDWEEHLEEGADEKELYLPDEYTPADQIQEDVLVATETVDHYFRGENQKRLDSQAHVQSVLNFVNPAGWGFVKSKSEVAGFQSHRFRSRPVVLNSEGMLDELRITRLELVSLLKHEMPRVYVEGKLPDLDSFDSEDVPTRQLNQFEARALKFVRQGKDIVIDEQDDHIRMFGSLRAIGECQQCHDVPKNTLLGAFSYELRKPHVSLSQK